MIRMKIGSNSPYLEELQYVLAKMGSQAKVLPRTAAAMEAGAKLIQARWVEFAGGGALEGVKKLERPRGGYARSIRTERLGPYSHEVYSEAEVADWIENGTEILDMKRTHPFGPRSRVSEDGIPYLIVPFQWGTKEGTKRAGPRNIVPKNLLSSMRNKKRFERSTVKGKYRAQESVAGRWSGRLIHGETGYLKAETLLTAWSGLSKAPPLIVRQEQENGTAGILPSALYRRDLRRIAG